MVFAWCLLCSFSNFEREIAWLDYEHTAYDSGRSVRVVRVTTAEYRSVREHLHVFKGMRWLARPSKEKQQNFVLFLFFPLPSFLSRIGRIHLSTRMLLANI